MFNKQLFVQIVSFLNSLAVQGKTTAEIADIIVICFPAAWLTVLGQGVYTHRLTTMLGDTALVSLDIVNQSINLRPK